MCFVLLCVWVACWLRQGGISYYEWSVVAIDPRSSNLLDSASPGNTMRNVVEDFMTLNDVEAFPQPPAALPQRAYGSGRVQSIFDVANAVTVAAWVRTTETIMYR